MKKYKNIVIGGIQQKVFNLGNWHRRWVSHGLPGASSRRRHAASAASRGRRGRTWRSRRLSVRPKSEYVMQEYFDHGFSQNIYRTTDIVAQYLIKTLK